MYITDIFFDLDRTLWDFDLNAENTLVELCKTYDLLALGIKTNEFIKSYTLHNERLWSLYRENKIKNTQRGSIKIIYKEDQDWEEIDTK